MDTGLGGFPAIWGKMKEWRREMRERRKKVASQSLFPFGYSLFPVQEFRR